ncbi:heme-binding protein [Candidatus Dependentiae bacterium]
MKLLVAILFLVFFAFVGWQLWYALQVNLKEPGYTVLQKKHGYEIRKYEPYIIAHVVFPGSYKAVANKGFRVLANYIFGGNKQNVRMSMTAPVFVEKKVKIDGYDIAFVMPPFYKKETLPEPKDDRIKITEKPSEKVAAYSFTWYPSAKRVKQKKEEFMALLKRDGITQRSNVILARYNPPFILPFLMRNELLVIIEE